LHLLKERLEAIEVFALLAIGDFLGRSLLFARANMTEFGDIGSSRRALQFGQQLVLIDRLCGDRSNSFRPGQQSLMVHRHEKRSAFLKRAKAVESLGIEPFKNVTILAVLRRMTLRFDKALNFFESRDDALFTWRAPALLLGLRELVEFGTQFV